MLQTFGDISLSDIGIEFQSDIPYRLSNFYGLDGLQTFGLISLTDFYGKAFYTIEIFIPEKTYYAYVGKSCTISTSYIIDGVYEIGNLNNSFTVVGVTFPINGEVNLNGNYIEFISTGLVGEEAGFKVTLEDNNNRFAKIDIGINIIELPPVTIPDDGDEGCCLINEVLGINEILEKEPSLICSILSE